VQQEEDAPQRSISIAMKVAPQSRLALRRRMP